MAEVNAERLRAVVKASGNDFYRLNADWSEVQSIGDQGAAAPIRSWADTFMHPRDWESLRASAESAIQSGSVFEAEHPIRLGDGDSGWAFTRIVPLRGQQGNVIEWIGTTRDITAQRRTKEPMGRSHEPFYQLIQNHPFGVYIVDANFRLAHVSMGAQKVFANVRPLLGRDFAQVLRQIWPDPFAGEAIARFRHTLATGDPYVAKSTVEQRNDIDAVEAYDWRIERITLPDGSLGVVCYFYDLSDRQRWEAALRQSEERFRQVFEHAPTGIAIASLDGAILHCNAAFAAITGYSEDELKSMHLGDLTEQQPGTVEPCRPGSRVTCRYRHRDYRVVWVEQVVATLHDASGVATRLLVLASDISDRTHAQEAADDLRRKQEAGLLAGEVGIFEWDVMNDRLWGDRNFGKIFNVHLDETGAAPIAEYVAAIHPDDRARVMEAVMRTVDTGCLYEAEYRVQQTNRWVIARGIGERDLSGNVIRFPGVVVDITKQKEAERAQKESESAQRFLLALSDALRPMADPGEIQSTAQRMLGERLGASRVGYAEVLESGEIIAVTSDYANGVPSIAGHHRVTDFSPVMFNAFRAGRSVVTDDINNDALMTSAEKAKADDLQIGAAAHLPLVKNGKFVALLFAHFNTPHRWTSNELALMEAVAERTWAAVERARAEKALRQVVDRYERQVRLFEGVVSTTQDFVYLFDLQGRFQYANRRLLEVWGMTLEDVIGKTCRQLGYEQWHHDMHMREIAQVIETKRPIKGEVPFEAPLTGVFGVYEYIFTPVIGPDGEVELIAGTTRDVTERKEAEEAVRVSESKYRTLFNSIDEGFNIIEMIFDEQQRPVDYRILESNPAQEKMTGLRDVEGKCIRELVPSLQQSWIDRYGQVALTGVPARFESWAEGLNRWLEVYASRVGGDGSHKVALVFNDITGRKQSEDQLRALNESLEQRVAERTAEVRQQAIQLRGLASQLSKAEQLERKRLAKILHDHIQQIIVAAQMQVGWMKRDTDIERIHTAAMGLQGTLQEALQASRSLAVELSPPVLQEAGLSGGLNWLAKRMFEQHQFSVDLRASTKAEPPTEEMRLLLFECARELLLNAVKHSGVREASIALARWSDDTVRLIVRDEGKGFDPDVVRKRRPDEVSFGLFSIQERLTHLGGHMEIESAPGRGTQVSLLVPVEELFTPTESAGDGAAEARAMPNARLVRKTDVCRVLVVDDHKIMRQGLVGLFEFESDIEVVGEASDGPEAIALADRLNPDVVIMDVNLGEMDGAEATRAILARHPEIKVVGLSMHTDKDVANAMRDAGAVAYVTKGGRLEDLVHSIRDCFR